TFAFRHNLAGSSTAASSPCSHPARVSCSDTPPPTLARILLTPTSTGSSPPPARPFPRSSDSTVSRATRGPRLCPRASAHMQPPPVSHADSQLFSGLALRDQLLLGLL